ncbi:MAG: hypothetical protein ACJ72M_19045 [Propionibacteriaceae bacterium]
MEVLFATAAGYIADDEDGKDRNRPAVSLRRTTGGIWESDPVVDFAANVGGPYMFRIKNAQGQTTYRTDIYSRWQIGRGSVDPREDLAGERAGAGARMFRFYQDLIRMRRVNRALRSRQIDIVHASNSNRVIAFTRRDG